jgi:nucleotide-binding universal stress UspA family protein
MLKMQRILVATDLGPAAAALAHRLDWMAAQARPSSVCLLHVVDEAALGAAAQWGLGERAALQARSLVGAEQQLQRLRGKLHLPATVAVEVHTLVGHPATCVAELCRSRRIDLLLAGSGNRLWRQALLGSTARRLLRQVDCALWLAREDAEAAQRIERALLAVDFGASCARALALARQCWPGTALEALHVVDSTLVEQAAELTAADPAGLASELGSRAQRRLYDWLDEQGVAGCPARALLGRPARSLLAEVAGSAAQALVLGRGDRGDAQASLGSVAEALAVHAECDLLLAARHP